MVSVLLKRHQVPRRRASVVLMLGTGLRRRSEALALHGDVDLTSGPRTGEVDADSVGRNLVFDEPKTDRSRPFVSLPSPVVETLSPHQTTLAAELLAAPVWQRGRSMTTAARRHTDQAA